MADVEINDLGSIGSIVDQPSHLIPPEAWTLALNMHSVDGGMEKLLGWEQIFGTPGVAPHFAMAVQEVAQTFWLYVSLAKAFGYDGVTHTDVTRAGGGGANDYSATNTRDWNGTLLGGIPLVNNGTDVPQYWAPVSLGQDLQNLTNWPATLRAKILRSFGPFLVAFNCTKSGTSFPHMVKWSHSADPGTLPISWDENDATLDTGEVELSDVQSGVIRDALQLGDTMYIYKESSVWRMRFIGGRFIFDFGKSAWLPTTGLLAPRCVCVTGDGTRQVWATQDDILWHNGNQVRSVLNGRQRRRLFNEIDTLNFENCFIFANPFGNEIYFCYPSSGMTNPNKALLMNYSGGEIWPVTEVDGITFRNAAVGNVEGASDEDWQANSNDWEVDDGPWSTLERRRVVLCGTDDTRFFNLDKGATRNGTVFTGTLRREGLSVLGKKRNGEWIVDFNTRKLFDELWPKIEGSSVSIRLGGQELVEGAVTWNPAITFDPSSQTVAYAGPISGRAGAIEVLGSGSWRIDGYNLRVTALGKF